MQTPSKKNWLYALFIGFITFMTLANFFGLGYFYHHYTYQSLTTQLKLKENQKNLEKIEETLHQKKPDTQQIFALYQIENLIHQAQFQLNRLSHVRAARLYLKFALQIAEKHHLFSLEETINHDLQTLRQIHLSHPLQVIAALHQIQQELENLQDPKSVSCPNTHASQPLWAKNLRPLIQIDRYQVAASMIYAPTEKAKIIQEAISLIPQIEYAAITKQQKHYRALLQPFTQLIERLPQNQNIQSQLPSLLEKHFKIENAMDFQSATQVQQLIQNEASA